MRSSSDSAVRIFNLCAAVGLAWFLLGFWIAGASERFYLLVPPVGLAILVRPRGVAWPRLKARIVSAGVGAAGLTFLSVAYGASLTWDNLLGFGREPRAGALLEILTAGYFVLSVSILVAGGYWLSRCLFTKLNCLWGGRRRWLGEGLRVLLTVFVCVPYLIGAFYIHRFKIPNASTPLESVGRPFEAVQFVTGDDLTIRGWFIPAELPSERTLLICHGLGANRSMFLPYLKVGSSLQSNVMMFDFRGHGESDGHTISLGSKEKLDVLAALHYLRHERSDQAREVIGLGISMGAAPLIGAAAEADVPFDALILDSGFASAVELTDQLLDGIPDAFRPYLSSLGIPLASLECGCRLSAIRPEDEVARIRAPVLITHARGDPLIPPKHALRLYQHAVQPKALWLAHTLGHGSALFRAEADYLGAITRWDKSRHSN